MAGSDPINGVPVVLSYPELLNEVGAVTPVVVVHEVEVGTVVTTGTFEVNDGSMKASSVEVVAATLFADQAEPDEAVDHESVDDHEVVGPVHVLVVVAVETTGILSTAIGSM